MTGTVWLTGLPVLALHEGDELSDCVRPLERKEDALALLSRSLVRSRA